MQDSVFSTPMMLQYQKLKDKYNDCVLLYRLGDFYEMFMDDAKLGSQLLDITLTSRDRGKDGRVPMCGVPYHALDSYLPKLVRAGYKVAICEQLSAPKKGGELVDREVVRIVTPGTLLNEGSLESKNNNYILGIHVENDLFGLALADVSTGLLYAEEYPTSNMEMVITNDLSKYNLSECVLPDVLYNEGNLLKMLKTHKSVNIFPYNNWQTHTNSAAANLLNHFGIKTLDIFGFGQKSAAQKACAGLLGYLKYTQKSDLSHIKKILALNYVDHVALDRSTIANLEIFSTVKDGSKKGSLLNFLDNTVTASGGRLLKRWVTHPLMQQEETENRLDVVAYLIKNYDFRQNITGLLSRISDIERILSRLSVGLGNPRDLTNLKETLITILALKKFMCKTDSELKLIHTLSDDISDLLQKLIDLLAKSLVELPGLDVRNGNFVNDGINKELDLLRQKVRGSKDFIRDLEIKEKQRTGISSLKVKYNQVFGYYIEISKSNLSNVPHDYMRKQTLVNAERFITPQLKEHEEIILTAEIRTKEIEYAIFLDLVNEVKKYTNEIQQAANSFGQVDVLCSFAHTSNEFGFVRPKITNDGTIDIKNGYHPVVASLMARGEFVPNDTVLDNENNQLLIITGPNMGGKSVYIRQTAIIVLLAQIGCFVPADSANISVVDKIFVRSGASDAISGGLSTFMVEMVETAYILNNATSNSLIVMDEIGRGTSTYDGISIAWAIAENLVQSDVRPKTLFATHYHELQKLEQDYPNQIKNMQVLVDTTGDKPIFLHKVASGAAAHSFGILVARHAGIPDDVCIRADAVMNELKLRANNHSVDVHPVISPLAPQLYDKLRQIDVSTTTPLEALNLLAELKFIIEHE